MDETAVISVSGGKGGTGKSSLATTLAGLAALRGFRVLFIDMDPSAGAGFDLGIRKGPLDDNGAALFDAITHGKPLQPLRNVRNNLDVACGGVMIEGLAGMKSMWQSAGREPLLALHESLEPVRHEYDLVVIDTPPGDSTLRDLALATADFVVVPSRSDAASIEGVSAVADSFRRVREVNSPTLLGVVLFGVGAGATKIQSSVRATLEARLGGVAPVFQQTIRHAEKASVESRKHGMLVFEYARDVAGNAPKWYEEGGRDVDVARSAEKVAEDHVKLSAEIISAIRSEQANRKVAALEALPR